METTSRVARFITERIEATAKLQKDVATKVGFDKPNMITMIKQGRTRLPLDKVGPMAMALETDPVALLQMCMEEYQPKTWAAIAPFMEMVLTEDERRLLTSLRASVGGPFLSALDTESREHFERLMKSLRASSSNQ